MPILLTCPQCRQPQSAPDSAAGKAARCGCGAILRLPTRASAPALVPSPPPASSLFDELSAADLGRLQNRTPAPTTEPEPHANPYQSPAAQYLARAAASQRHVTRRGEGKWLTWAVVGGLIGTVIVLSVGLWSVISEEAQFDRQARAAELGRALGMLASLFWGPTFFLLGRRFIKSLDG